MIPLESFNRVELEGKLMSLTDRVKNVNNAKRMCGARVAELGKQYQDFVESEHHPELRTKLFDSLLTAKNEYATLERISFDLAFKIFEIKAAIFNDNETGGYMSMRPEYRKD